jgi:hypothetical protein
MVWMRFPGDFGGKSVVCALAEAAEAACEEVRRISKRPAYDLIGHLGADYHLINARFTRTDVEDEDHDATEGTDDGRGGSGFGGNLAKVPC